jgi:VWFA-related protein
LARSGVRSAMGLAIHGRLRRQLRRAAIGALLALAGGAGEAQEQRRPDFTSRVDLITTDVVVRDNKGQFIADLKKADFQVLEDGVQQTLVSFSLTHGGRTYNIDAPPRLAIEGLAVPPARPAASDSGRIFFILVDDLHLDFRDTARVRDLFKRISSELVHDGDMFGIVSTGASAIEIGLSYDRRRLDQAAQKLSGSALQPGEVISSPQGAQGPAEVRHKAHVAFSTAAEAMRQLGEIHDRRKAFIYISNGYDLDPYAKTRAKNEAERYGSLRDSVDNSSSSDPVLRQQGNQFAFADLVNDLAEVTRAAVRANISIYSIDPRGLVAGPDLDQNVDRMEFLDSVRTQHDSLRVLADLTGGLAVVNQNDVTKALRRIDQETSDYYLVGYYSSNPDPLKKRRIIEVTVKRPGAVVWHRPSYTLRPQAGGSRD